MYWGGVKKAVENNSVCVCCACVCVCVRACVRACVCVCVGVQERFTDCNRSRDKINNPGR